MTDYQLPVGLTFTFASEKCDFADKLVVKNHDFVIDKTCCNCEHWYKNSKDRALNPKCPWRNCDVPKATDFCSRWERKESIELED